MNAVIFVIFAVCISLGSLSCSNKIDKDNNSVRPDNRPKVGEFADSGSFGFLIDQRDPADIYEAMSDTGATWLRPHVGSFIWGDMQSEKDGPLDFDATDSEVKMAQENGFNLLITLWPYADWDQKEAGDLTAIESGDGFFEDLPEYRYNPRDWAAYSKWLSAVIERYDGDGIDDMPELRTPVRHYEIGNEPDLHVPELTFYQGTPGDYIELLSKSYSIIKKADKNAQVLIAGAAGSQPEFIDFWEQVFADQKARDSFDIANIHSISGGNRKDLNVSPYKDLLIKHGISKPIWVTEAEGAADCTSSAENTAELNEYVKTAIAAGAEKIFFTHSSLAGAQNKYAPENLIDEQQFFKEIIDNNI